MGSTPVDSIFARTFMTEQAHEIELVLHRRYGGFSIDMEMALWLIENRQWTLIKHKDYDYQKRNEFPLNCLIEMGRDYYHPNSDSLAFRSQKDLLDCVRAIQEVYKNDSWSEAYHGHIQGLEITKVKIFAEIEDYNDGHERLNVWSREE